MNRLIIKLLFCIITVFHISFNGISQNIDLRESLYLHVNKRFLVSGEQLLFTAYVRSDLNKTLTNNSNILYVELIGQDGVEIQKKIKVTDGIGAGEIFINSSISTGDYRLIAYTRWMRNFNDFFEIQLTIANPYERAQQKGSLQNVSTQKPLLNIESAFADKELVNNIENALILNLKNVKSFEKYHAVLVDDKGKILKPLFFNEKGEAVDVFEPQSGNSYKIILTSPSGEKFFYDIKTVNEKKSALLVNKRAGKIKVEVSTNIESAINEYVLKVGNAQEELLKYDLIANTGILINEKKLPEGFLLFELFQNDDLIDQNWIINESPNKIEKERLAESFNTRESVNLSYKLPNGNYSVSITKIYENLKKKPFNAIYNEAYFNLKDSDYEIKSKKISKNPIHFQFKRFNPDSIHLLPESRNEILEGKLLGKDSENIKDVYLSFPHEEYQLVTSSVEEDKSFKLHYVSPKVNSVAYLGVFQNTENLDFDLESPFIGSTLKFDFKQVNFSPEQLKEIEEKSINIQIQDVYAAQEVDSISEPNNIPWQKPIINYEFEYLLENYKKFKTIEEHLTEYVTGARVKDNSIKITQINTTRNLSSTSLILLDGVPVSSEQVLKINPLQIKSIRIRRDLVFLYSTVFNGVLEFTTHNGAVSEMKIDNAIKMNIDPLQKTTAFADFIPEDNNIPDRNDQLLWFPIQKVENGNLSLQFTTSDLEGTFKVEIEGFSSEGKAVTLEQYFTVTQSLE